MTLVQSKQISKIISGSTAIAGFSAAGASNNISTVLGTALSTAGSGGVSVPLQPSTGETVIGVVTSGAANRVEINDGNLFTPAGNEVYGRVTETGGVYTLTYYSSVGGTETAYTLPATTIKFEFNYRFDFARLPADFAAIASIRIVGQGGGATGATVKVEAIAVTGANTLALLSKTPDFTANVLLIVNGVVETSLGTASFTVSGKTITWNAANSGYALAVADKVFAQYTTVE